MVSISQTIPEESRKDDVLGIVKEPKETDPEFEIQDAENQMVISWLLNSMKPEIGRPFLYLSTAKKVWDAVTKTYSKKGNAARIFKLKTTIHNTKQRDQSVIVYYNNLMMLQQELDLLQHFEMVAAKDAATIAKTLEWDQVFDFLAGLRPEFDEVQGRILGKEPISLSQ